MRYDIGQESTTFFIKVLQGLEGHYTDQHFVTQGQVSIEYQGYISLEESYFTLDLQSKRKIHNLTRKDTCVQL